MLFMKHSRKSIKSFPLRLKSPSKKVPKCEIFGKEATGWVKYLFTTVGVTKDVFCPTLFDIYFKYINHVSKHKGIRNAVLINKAIRTVVTKYLARDISIDRKGIKLTKDCLPVKLGPICKILRTIRQREGNEDLRKESVNSQILQIVLSVLNYTRSIVLRAIPDIGSIIQPISVNLPLDLEGQIAKFAKRLIRLVKSRRQYKMLGRDRMLLTFNGDSDEPHLTSKVGPTGVQALYSCLDDLENLPKSLIQSIKVLGGPKVGLRIDSILTCLPELRECMEQPTILKKGKVIPSKVFRKISYFADPEGKTRVIAIGDYWSQNVLLFLHNQIYKLLSFIPHDETFEQGNETCRSFKFDGQTRYFCYDLKSFTDRFPIRLIRILLTYLIGPIKAEAWYNIMVGYPFTYKDPNGSSREISYSVGNPMGFYTSWGTTTLCHHMIFYIACQNIGIKWYSTAKYIILGDDVVIWDQNLALEYSRLISSIGVQISIPKTVVSFTYAEFAKRVYTLFGEISPLSFKGMKQHMVNYSAMVDYIHTSIRRGFKPHTGWLFACVQFYQIFKPLSAKANKVRITRLELAKAVYDYSRGIISDSVLINTYLMTLNLETIGCNRSKISKDIMIRAIVSTFMYTAGKVAGDAQDRLFKAILRYTQDGERNSQVLTAIYNHPYCFIVGRFIEESYLEQMSKLWSIVEFSKFFWSYKQRNMIILDFLKVSTDGVAIQKAKLQSLFIKHLRQSIAQILSENRPT